MNTQGMDEAVRAAVEDGVPGIIAGVVRSSGERHVTAAGVRRAGENEPVSTDSVFALYSASKAITATAALQCVEDGLLDLDAPAAEILPELGEIGVLTSVDPDGTAHTRPPKTAITPRMLLWHTAGFGYDMFDTRLAAISRARSRSGETPDPMADLRRPLLHDPGTAWTYGVSIDWLGLVVQAVRGERLEDVFRQRIFTPCGMDSTSFDVGPELRARLVPAHRRRADGTIRVSPMAPPERAAVDLGGQGLFSTVPDYLSFLSVWLGDGSAPGGRVLSPETIAWATEPAPGVTVRPLTSAIAALTLDVDLFPGTPKSWATSFLRTDADLPGGRRAGSLSWAGLANVHYWIDRSSGVAAIWAAQLLPWFDPAAEAGFSAFERSVYRA